MDSTGKKKRGKNMKLSKTLMINETLLPSSKKAFTLAEVLITLSILGVVAALTIPNLVNRQSDIAAQTRLKKAISNYHDVVEVYMIENETQNAKDMLKADCSNASLYFKITQQQNCTFVTADGTSWVWVPATGNAYIADTNLIAGNKPRYGVILWNANGFVNSDQCNDNNQCGTAVAPPPVSGDEPTNGYYNAKEFITATGAQLRAKTGRSTVANAYAADAAASTSGAASTGSGLKNAIAAP